MRDAFDLNRPVWVHLVTQAHVALVVRFARVSNAQSDILISVRLHPAQLSHDKCHARVFVERPEPGLVHAAFPPFLLRFPAVGELDPLREVGHECRQLKHWAALPLEVALASVSVGGNDLKD